MKINTKIFKIMQFVEQGIKKKITERILKSCLIQYPFFMSLPSNFLPFMLLWYKKSCWGVTITILITA